MEKTIHCMICGVVQEFALSEGCYDNAEKMGVVDLLIPKAFTLSAGNDYAHIWIKR